MRTLRVQCPDLVPPVKGKRWPSFQKTLCCSHSEDTRGGDEPEVATWLASPTHTDSFMTVHGPALCSPGSTLQSDDHDVPRRATSTTRPTEKYGMFTFVRQPRALEDGVDIIAVHGLGGHYKKTWTFKHLNANEGTSCNWLKYLLPQKVPNARIMSFGYNAAVTGSRSVSNISDFGLQLLRWVLLQRSSKQEKCRPLIFVCHSLGGIVLKVVRPLFLSIL